MYAYRFIVPVLFVVALTGCPPAPTPPRLPEAAFSANLPGEDPPAPGESILGFDEQEVEFTDLSDPGTDGITVWQWDFGDGNVSDEPDPVHTYAKAGTFTVTLRVIGPLGSSTAVATNLVEIRARTLPEAKFSANVTRGLDPLTVRFSNTSNPGSADALLSHVWDFGDGTTSDELSPVHEYTAVGLYTVSLTVATAAGEDTETMTDYIAVVPPQSAEFSADIDEGFAPLTVQFTNLSESGVDDDPSFLWNFGDGSTSTQASPAHVYNVPGTYTVSLRVSTASETTLETKSALIEVLPTEAPSASFTAEPTGGRAPLFVLFEDTSDLGTGTSVTWAWDFGDGDTSTEQNPLHAYTEPGTYTVILVVTTEHGDDTEVREELITVTAPPEADFTASPDEGFAPLDVQFTNLSTPAGQITGNRWNFGDGSTSILSSPSHRYVTPGAYTVTLRVETGDGADTETRPAFVVVRATTPPTAAFTATPRSGRAPLTVLFTDGSDLGTGTQPEWAWLFGDEEVAAEGEGEGEVIPDLPPSSEEQDPQHIYTEPGLYDVTLTITTEHGEDTITLDDFIEVTP